jgi:broad specificity phosphatase PhoE
MGDAMAPTTFYLVQHGKKEPTPGDPSLTVRGRMQARQTADALRDRRIRYLYSSPQRRARETAAYLAVALGLPVQLDARLRERMNWGDDPSQTLDDFLSEWERASSDRDFTPQSGESSRRAGDRLRAFLDEFAARHPGEAVALVTHGGVTVDLLRTLFGDDDLQRRAPDLVRSGPQGCAITHLSKDQTGYALHDLASVAHLTPDVRR